MVGGARVVNKTIKRCNGVSKYKQGRVIKTSKAQDNATVEWYSGRSLSIMLAYDYGIYNVGNAIIQNDV